MPTKRKNDVFTSIPARRRPSPVQGIPVRKGRKPPPENETARGRFLRIGQPRVVSAIKAIRLLGNLARGDYAWDRHDVETMKATLQAELDITMQEFEKAKPAHRDLDFHFDTSELEQHLTSA